MPRAPRRHDSLASRRRRRHVPALFEPDATVFVGGNFENYAKLAADFHSETGDVTLDGPINQRQNPQHFELAGQDL